MSMPMEFNVDFEFGDVAIWSRGVLYVHSDGECELGTSETKAWIHMGDDEVEIYEEFSSRIKEVIDLAVLKHLEKRYERKIEDLVLEAQDAEDAEAGN